MSETTPERGPIESRPGDNPDAPDPTQPVETDGDAVSPEDVRTQPPAPNKGSGQFAVWDHDLGQYVSGVSDKSTADKARKGLEDHNGAVTDGHKLETPEV